MLYRCPEQRLFSLLFVSCGACDVLILFVFLSYRSAHLIRWECPPLRLPNHNRDPQVATWCTASNFLINQPLRQQLRPLLRLRPPRRLPMVTLLVLVPHLCLASSFNSRLLQYLHHLRRHQSQVDAQTTTPPFRQISLISSNEAAVVAAIRASSPATC